MSDDLKARIDELADLIDEYALASGTMSGDEWSIEFALEPKESAVAFAPAVATDRPAESPRPTRAKTREKPVKEKAAPAGTPITSPMMGIWYSSPSPGSPAFVKVGGTINAGDVIGLVEAMKVFNEITATVSGTVTSLPVENGQLVQPGETLATVS